MYAVYRTRECIILSRWFNRKNAFWQPIRKPVFSCFSNMLIGNTHRKRQQNVAVKASRDRITTFYATRKKETDYRIGYLQFNQDSGVFWFQTIKQLRDFWRSFPSAYLALYPSNNWRWTVVSNLTLSSNEQKTTRHACSRADRPNDEQGFCDRWIFERNTSGQIHTDARTHGQYFEFTSLL